MKIRLLLLSLFSLILTDCHDSFFDITPNSVNAESFYVTEDHALAAISAAYDPLQWDGAYRNFLWTWGDISSDDSDKGDGGASDGPQWIQFDNFTLSAENDELSEGYIHPFAGIYRANLVLEKVPEIEMDEALKDRILAEALFLRGLYYFNLVQAFGDVPIITSVLNADELEVSRSPASDGWAQIKADFTEAATRLPESYTGADVGRATKGAALALLAKSELYTGDYANAATHAQQVVDLGVYELVDGDTFEEKQAAFLSQFKTEGDNNSESVFEVQFLRVENEVDAWGEDNKSEGNMDHQYYGLRNDSGQKGNAVDGTAGWGFNMPTMDLVNDFEDGDIRLGATVFLDGDEFRGHVFGGDLGITSNGTLNRKYLNEDLSFSGNGIQQGNNIKVIRYAEVLLMLAESLNETNNGPTTEAYAALNQVRNRADLDDAPTGMSQEQFRQFVWHERRVELAMEGVRWGDLKRQGRAVAIMKSKGKSLDEDDLLVPIPQIALDRNPNLTQNPGY